MKELQRLLNVEYDYQKTSGIMPIEPRLAVDSNLVLKQNPY